MVDLQTQWGGYFTGPEIVSRVPFAAPSTWRHELGHHMDIMTGTAFAPTSRSPEWQQAILRWRKDPQYPRGAAVWRYITGGHPSGSTENPAWHEGYAHAADFPLSEVPRYMRKFYPWRDWQEIEATTKRGQERYNVEQRLALERDRVYGAEVAIQSALDAGIDSLDFERMWMGNYQEQPIPSMVFSFVHDKVGSPQEARASWDRIDPDDRMKALRWFFEGAWPAVKDHPGDWQNVKDFLDYIGIEGWGIVSGAGLGPWTAGPYRRRVRYRR